MAIKPQKGDKGKNITPTPDRFPNAVFNYPVFCFKYLSGDYGLEHCETKEKAALIDRLHKLSSMTWDQIRQAHKHGLGQEKIAREAIKTGIPERVTPDITLYALRYDGKRPIVGFKSDFIFHILFIDRDFTLYDHG